MSTKKEKSLGSLERITIDITEPVPMKHINLEYNQFMILIGHNGAGKSLVLKLTWLMGTQMCHAITSKNNGIPYNSVAGAQFLFDNTFSDNNFTGTIVMTYKFGYFAEAILDNGKVISAREEFDDCTSAPQPVFMSTNTRTFDDIIPYLKMKKMIGLPKGFPTVEADLGKLLEIYKLFDVILIEQLIHRIENNTTPDIVKKYNETIQGFDKDFKDIQNIKMKEDGTDVLYTDDTGKDVSFTRMGKGHQSLSTTFLVQIYQTS